MHRPHGLPGEVQKVVELTGIDRGLTNVRVMPCTVGVGPE
jgi:hypothetical protein